MFHLDVPTLEFQGPSFQFDIVVPACKELLKGLCITLQENLCVPKVVSPLLDCVVDYIPLLDHSAPYEVGIRELHGKVGNWHFLSFSILSIFLCENSWLLQPGLRHLWKPHTTWMGQDISGMEPQWGVLSSTQIVFDIPLSIWTWHPFLSALAWAWQHQQTYL